MIELAEVPAPPKPTTEGSRSRSWLRITFEVLLISVGVFLGLMGEQWRERSQKRDLAVGSLQRFRSEFVANRKAVHSVRESHADDEKKILTYLNSDAVSRARLPYPFQSTNPAFLEYSAWDVALATQSLAYIDQELAHRIAHVYSVQRQLDGATRDITHVMYSKTGYPDPISLLTSMVVYFGDCNLIEPRLIALYDEIIPQLDRALGVTPAGR
jgi:hypothetical protein